jgi:Ser/Thr protein kinase RdoA (MazF antagonist)
MAVYTDLTHPKYREQFAQVEQAFAITIVSIEGMAAGSSDTKFQILIQDSPDSFVLTIHETPDVTAAGLSGAAAGNMLRYVDYLAGAAVVVLDRFGEPVNLSFLTPLRARQPGQAEAPSLELTFDGVRKTVSIVPFIKGKTFENSPGELVEPAEAYLAGRALAAYATIARSYPESFTFERYDFQEYSRKVSRLANEQEVMDRLGYVLSAGRLEGAAAEAAGREYLAEMDQDGRALLEKWRDFESDDSPFTPTLIHGDLFTDNTLIDEHGRLIMIDFSEVTNGNTGLDIGVSINSWAAQNGRPDKTNVIRFLEGFDSVTPLTRAALTLIPTYARFGAFRWETFRIQRITMQDPRQFNLRSPAELQSLRHAWRALQRSFEGLESLSDLSRIDFGS